MFSHPSLPHTARPDATRRRIFSFAATLSIAGVALAGLFASSAQAALISTGACNDAALSQPFARWGDSTQYELLSGGDFEGSTAGWTLSSGAQRVAGSENYNATGSAGGYSLVLPAGASAQSPFTCVNASYPTFRFFARQDKLLSALVVQVVYKTAVGTVVLPIGAAALSGQWSPTLPMLTGSIVTGLLSGGTAQVALRFTEVLGSSHIDDVFVDPRMR